MRNAAALGLFATSCLLTACAENGGPQIDGAGPIIAQTVAASQVDLFSALDPADKGCWGSVSALPPKDASNPACTSWNKDDVLIPESGQHKRPLLARAGLYDLLGLNDTRSENASEAVKHDRVRLQRAFQGFYSYNTNDAAERRNRVMERLILASNQNCGQFLQTLHGVQGATNFGLGSLTTATAGAGAIIEDGTAARSLAGAAAILSGVRAEMNEDFYRNIFSDALSKAIEIKRQETQADLRRQYAVDIKNYPVEAAVADALTYNNQCSLVSGLSFISASVNMSADPAGLRTLEAAFKKTGYNATVAVQVTKSYEGDAMAGVGAPVPITPKAAAVAAIKEIESESARVLASAVDANEKVKSGSAKATQKKAAADSIANAVKLFAKAPLKTVELSGQAKAIKDLIDALAKTYNALSAQNIDTKNSDTIARQLLANDTTVNAVMPTFREYVADAISGVNEAVASAK